MSALAGEIIVEAERRGAERQQTNDAAVTLMRGRQDSVSCVVRDISDTGARIRLKSPNSLPERFKLCIPDKHLLAECEQVWQRDNEIGLRFRSVAFID